MQIRHHWQTRALVLALALAGSALSARPQDQIVLIHDAEGRAVYINAPEPDLLETEAIQASSPGRPDPSVRHMITQTAHSLEVDPKLVDAVVQVESGYHTRARSPKGALGLMQLMPATAARFGVNDPFDTVQNLRGGVTYLGHLLKQFNGDVPLSLAAYNAGEGTVLRRGGIPEFQETRDYIRKVMALYPAPQAPVGGAANGQAADSLNPVPHERLAADNAASRFPIYRYVDVQGVVHFTQ
jgi:soluble lytic murein transglycosylase-like protein